MMVFGFGISTDVDNLSFAVLDRDQSHESRAYLEELRGSPLLHRDSRRSSTTPTWRAGCRAASQSRRSRFRRASAATSRAGGPTEVGAWIDGAMPFRAETIRGYLEGVHQQFSRRDLAIADARRDRRRRAGRRSRSRFRYNQDFDSIYAMVPGTIALLLALIPAILMALAVVREKELGSITNLYVTPVTAARIPARQAAALHRHRDGQFRPHVADGASSCSRCRSRAAFRRWRSARCIYVTATTGYRHADLGLHPHADRGPVRHGHPDHLPATQFSGMLTPVSSLTGVGAVIGRGFPMTYFLPISVGTFTKGLGFADLAGDLLALALFVPILTAAEPRCCCASRSAERRHAHALGNIFWLGTKELRSFFRDFVLLGLVSIRSRFAVYRAGAEQRRRSCTTRRSGIVDEDHSALSRRMVAAFLPPYFKPPVRSPSATSTADESRRATLSSSTSRRISNATCWPADSPACRSTSTPPP